MWNGKALLYLLRWECLAYKLRNLFKRWRGLHTSKTFNYKRIKAGSKQIGKARCVKGEKEEEKLCMFFFNSGMHERCREGKVDWVPKTLFIRGPMSGSLTDQQKVSTEEMASWGFSLLTHLPFIPLRPSAKRIIHPKRIESGVGVRESSKLFHFWEKSIFHPFGRKFIPETITVKLP